MLRFPTHLLLVVQKQLRRTMSQPNRATLLRIDMMKQPATNMSSTLMERLARLSSIPPFKKKSPQLNLK
jgi:hypothetical protein